MFELSVSHTAIWRLSRMSVWLLVFGGTWRRVVWYHSGENGAKYRNNSAYFVLVVRTTLQSSFCIRKKLRFDNSITCFGTAEGALTIFPDFESQLGIQSMLYQNNLDFQHQKVSYCIRLPTGYKATSFWYCAPSDIVQLSSLLAHRFSVSLIRSHKQSQTNAADQNSLVQEISLKFLWIYFSATDFDPDSLDSNICFRMSVDVQVDLYI